MSSSWIKFRSGPKSPKLRLFCFPYAGGTATIFRQWHRELPADVELCPVEYPGHGTRRDEPLMRRIDALVGEARNGLATEITVPYAFFGHSLGAVVAFELARAFRDTASRQPEHLFVSGRRAVQLPIPHTDMHTQPDKQFLATILERYGGIPKEVIDEPELLAMMLPMARADIEMYETYQYRPGPQLSCPITGFCGNDDMWHPKQQLLPWQEQTSSSCPVYSFAGGHFFLNTARGELLKQMSADLQPYL